MKLFIASDIHGSALYCRQMLSAFQREKADRMLLLGDILYHGPRNSLPDEYDPKAVIAALNERKESILCVRGNCDTEVDQMVLSFPLMADYALICQDGVTAYATHGHIFSPSHLPPLRKGDLLLCGHTHIPAWEDHGGFPLSQSRLRRPPQSRFSPGLSPLGRPRFHLENPGWRSLSYFGTIRQSAF